MPIGKSGAATQNALMDEVTRPQQRIEDDASGIDAVDEGIRPHHVGFFSAYDVDDTESGDMHAADDPRGVEGAKCARESFVGALPILYAVHIGPQVANPFIGQEALHEFNILLVLLEQAREIYIGFEFAHSVIHL